MSDTDTTSAAAWALLTSEVSGCRERIAEMEALVESAYREGFIDGYDDDARPQDADSGWEHSEARRELEPPR